MRNLLRYGVGFAIALAAFLVPYALNLPWHGCVVSGWLGAMLCEQVLRMGA